jgi:hypothetical protein
MREVLMSDEIEPNKIAIHPQLRKLFKEVLSIIQRHKKTDENGKPVWEPGQETFRIPEEEITPTLEALRIVLILSSTYREVRPDEPDDDDDFCMFLLIAALSDWTNSDDDFAEGRAGLFSTEGLANSKAKTLTYMLAAISYCAQAIRAESDDSYIKAWKHLANAKYWSGASLGTWAEATVSKENHSAREFLSRNGKKGGKKRHEKTNKAKNYAIKLYMESPYSSSRKPRAAAKSIEDDVVKYAGSNISEYSAFDTIYKWLLAHEKERVSKE